MEIKSIILALFKETLEATDSTMIGELNDETILLKSGLDSLGFAILVARLEEELGYDPFTLMSDAVYPQTMGEFIAIYEKFKSCAV